MPVVYFMILNHLAAVNRSDTIERILKEYCNFLPQIIFPLFECIHYMKNGVSRAIKCHFCMKLNNQYLIFCHYCYKIVDKNVKNGIVSSKGVFL